MTPPTPEQIAEAQAAMRRRPDDAELVTVTQDVVDGAGHVIKVGSTAWRYLGAPRYDGPPDATSTTHRSVLWKCVYCAQRRGWAEPEAGVS
jgi:hypothetical protein